MDGTKFKLNLCGLPPERGLALVPRRWLERQVSAALKEINDGVAPATVECPDALEARVGATTRCTATTPTGFRYRVVVTVTEAEEGDIKVWIENERMLTVGRTWLEQACISGFEKAVGMAAAKVECPDPLAAEVGATTRCVLTDPDGMRLGVTATCSKVDGDTPHVHFKTDDTPMA